MRHSRNMTNTNNTNTTVTRIDRRNCCEVYSTERVNCSICGVDGWRGDFPNQGGIVYGPDGNLTCDDCAD